MDQELLDRTRRIETRITRIGNHLGIDVGGSKPTWDPERQAIVLPTPNCSISDCLAIIPAEIGPGMTVDVFIADQYLTTLCKRPG